MRKSLTILCSLLVVAWLSGCATMETPKQVPYKVMPGGMVIWEDEIEFKIPPPRIKSGKEGGVTNEKSFSDCNVDHCNGIGWVSTPLLRP